MNIGDKDEKPSETLAALDNPELCRLFHRIGEITSCIGKSDDRGSGRLRLQEKGCEILAREGMTNCSDNLAAGFCHQSRGVALKSMPECIIRRNEEPRVPSALDHGAAGSVRERPGVVGPVDSIGGALRFGQIRGATA